MNSKIPVLSSRDKAIGSRVIDQQASRAIAKVIGSRQPSRGESIGVGDAVDIIEVFKKQLGLKPNKILGLEQKQALLTRLGAIGFDISMSDVGKRTRSQLGIKPKKEIQATVEPTTVTPADRGLAEDLASKVIPDQVKEQPVEAQSLSPVE